MSSSKRESIGYLCTFTPKELIHAAGFTPIRILAGNEPISLATAHIQSYACSQARGCLELALKGKLDLKGVVFTRTCDTLMRLADIWERNTDMLVYSLEFPVRIDERSKEFFLRELRDLVIELEKWGGEITPENLKNSILIYKELEEKLKLLFSLKPDYRTVIDVQRMDPEKAVEVVGDRLERAKDELDDAKDKPRVLVTGSVCPFTDVFDVLQETGLFLVDDMCTGTRFFTFDYPEEINIDSVEDGLLFLVDKYFGKAPCPTKHYMNDQRFNYLLKMAEQCDGAIFLLLKFCDPHFFDYPQIKEKLEKMGKRTLLVELEFPVASLEQLRTRIEAFYEVLTEKSE